jgi:hypothetical protein
MMVCNGAGMAASQARVDDGDREMAATESGLGRDYPDVAPDVIHTLVQLSYNAMTPAKVHNYLPLLVVRDVRAQLRDRVVA